MDPQTTMRTDSPDETVFARKIQRRHFLRFTGAAASSFTGTLYFPSTSVNYTGNSTGTFTAIIAKTLQFTGTSNIKNDPTGSYTGLGGHSSSLIQ